MLLAIHFSAAALSADPIKLEAHYDPSTGQLNGHIQSVSQSWIGPLNHLTAPRPEWLQERSFPFNANQGTLNWSTTENGLEFTTQVPERWDLAGQDSHGLYMNGLWHPQFATERQDQWQVHVSVPADWWIVLNGGLSQGTAYWEGPALVHDLAVFPKANITTSGPHVMVSARSAHQKAKRLTSCLSENYPQTTVVIAPMHHRLVVTGTNQIWLSEHALDGDLGLWKAHCLPIDRAFKELYSSEVDPWFKALDAFIQKPPVHRLEHRLESIEWLPQIDYILYSGRLPYQGDIFDKRHIYPVPTWQSPYPMRYPLPFVYHNMTLQLSEAKMTSLSTGTSALEARLIEAGLSREQLHTWQSAPLQENIRIQKKNGQLWLWKNTIPTSAESQNPIPVLIDGETRLISFAPDQVRHPLPEAQSVVIDPNETILQTTRSDDRYPQHWHVTGVVFPYSITTDNWRPSIVGRLTLRPHPRHPLRIVSALNTTPTIMLSVEQYLMVGWGKPIDSRARPFNSWISTGLQFPDQFRTPVHTLELGSNYNTQSTWLFPRSGIRTALSVGRAQKQELSWFYSKASWAGILNLSPRLVLGQRLSTAQTASEEYATQYPIGGINGIAGESVNGRRGQWTAVSQTEIRILMLRNQNIHLPFVCWTDLIGHIGLDMGYVGHPHGETASGITAGLSFAGNSLHVLPGYLGISAGWSPDHPPQFYVHSTHRL